MLPHVCFPSLIARARRITRRVSSLRDKTVAETSHLPGRISETREYLHGKLAVKTVFMPAI